ncbi:hypothetical protein KKH65_03455 [bacterium]|nr:hypothetical protein [bacterium]
MSIGLEASIRRKSDDSVLLEIKKEDFEAFSSAVGLFKKGFLDILDASDRDSKEGAVKERESLLDII